jgi:hypothetical protein
LIQLIKVSLVRHLLNQVAATWLKDLEGPMNWTWGTVRTGIVSWLTWDKESLLGQKFEVLIGWFYQEGKGAHLYEAELLPANYQEFCQICDMLGVTPHDLGIPFACTGDVDIDGILYYAFPPLTADLLDLGDPFPVAAPAMIRDRQDLAEYQSQGNGRLIHSFLGKNITIFTLFDYTVHTYGRETLPVLLAASGAHSQLYTAIPAVYGVSLAEFEEDWRTYLQEKYASE